MRRIEEDIKEEEEEIDQGIDPLEEVDLDPGEEIEDLMSPRRRLLWQSMCIMLVQPEMQVTTLQLQISLSTTSRENAPMLVMQDLPFGKVSNRIGKH